MKRSRGYTLVETLIASVIILVVLTALAVAVSAFMRGSRALELQEGALTLARVEIARMERREQVPETGTYSRSDTLWGHRYEINTMVIMQNDNTRDVQVAVSSGDSLTIELQRRFYTD